MHDGAPSEGGGVVHEGSALPRRLLSARYYIFVFSLAKLSRLSTVHRFFCSRARSSDGIHTEGFAVGCAGDSCRAGFRSLKILKFIPHNDHKISMHQAICYRSAFKYQNWAESVQRRGGGVEVSLQTPFSSGSVCLL